MLKLVVLCLVAAIAVEACQQGWSPDMAAQDASCDAAQRTCTSDGDCMHGQQCCFETSGCRSQCHHPDHGHGGDHTAHPHPTHAGK